jgi:hypothetical protein
MFAETNRFSGKAEPGAGGFERRHGKRYAAGALGFIFTPDVFRLESFGVADYIFRAGTAEDFEETAGVVMVAVAEDNAVDRVQVNAENAGIDGGCRPAAGIEEDAPAVGFNKY